MRFSGLLVTSLLVAGCIQYNEQCQGLVEDPGERVAFLAAEVFLDKPNTRHANNAIGQAAADAFVDAFADTGAPARFGVENGGAIRGEGLCVSRNVLPAGPLSNGVLHEILLFENIVSAVDLSEPEILQMFEHSVARLVPNGQPVGTPAGQFLQVSAALRLRVDCARPPGERVVALAIGADAISKPGRSHVTYRVALSSFLLGGGDGYAMLVEPGTNAARNPAQAQKLGGTDANLSADFLRRTFNKDQQSGLRVDPARIDLVGCAVPARPSG